MATDEETRKDGLGAREEIPSDEARQRLGELMDRAGFKNERIIITRHGKPLVALIGMDDLAALDAA